MRQPISKSAAGLFACRHHIGPLPFSFFFAAAVAAEIAVAVAVVAVAAVIRIVLQFATDQTLNSVITIDVSSTCTFRKIVLF